MAKNDVERVMLEIADYLNMDIDTFKRAQKSEPLAGLLALRLLRVIETMDSNVENDNHNIGVTERRWDKIDERLKKLEGEE